MKISVRLHLHNTKTNADGSNPIVLEYSINKVRKRKVLDRCMAIDWDSKNNRVKSRHKKADIINNMLSKELANAERNVYEIKSGLRSIDEVFGARVKVTLQDAIDRELIRLEKNFMSGFYDKVRGIQKQVPDTSIALSDINKKWFDKMIGIFTDLGNTGGTIQKKVKLIRGLIGRYSENGITKEIKDVRVTTQKSLKVKLSASELLRIEQLILPEGEQIEAVRDLFLLQIYLRGIRVGDLLQAQVKHFSHGRFNYTADKTDKTLTIKLIPQAQVIVDKYAGKHKRLFPFFIWEPSEKATPFENERSRLKHKETCTTIVNKHLKVIAAMCGIDKPLSSHIARHTFARMAIDKINNPMVTMELLGHSSLAVHQAYLNDIRKDDVLDAAADDIFG
jgi:integrase